MKTWMLTAAAGLLAISAAAVLVAKPAKQADVVKEPSQAPAKAKDSEPVSPLDFKLKTIDGKEMDLAQYKGKVVMLVNVASKCGRTPQYAPLEAAYKKYQGKGLVIVGIPANNFGGQEPGTEADIKAFCEKNYGVTFPMASKISVKGDDQHPLYKFLTSKDTAGDFAGDIDWNFAKFLVDRNGNVMARFASGTKPDDEKVVKAIEAALNAETKTASAE